MDVKLNMSALLQINIAIVNSVNKNKGKCIICVLRIKIFEIVQGFFFSLTGANSHST